MTSPSDSLYVDSVVLGVRAKEADVDHPISVVDPYHQPILVPCDVEHHPVIPEDTRIPKVGLDGGRRRPIRLQRVSVPGQDRFLRVRVTRLRLPERLERGKSDDPHSPILVPNWDSHKRTLKGGYNPGQTF